MLVEDLFGASKLNARDLSVIKAECSQFLKETAGFPLFKPLPAAYTDVQRVKVRLRKTSDIVQTALNEAFSQRFTNLSQRAIFTYSTQPTLFVEQDMFYVFPRDGYQYLYSKEVTNSSSDYRKVIDTLFEQYSDMSKASALISDLLKYTYASTDLVEAVKAEAEVIVYGVPYYYAVRATTSSYPQLLKMITK